MNQKRQKIGEKFYRIFIWQNFNIKDLNSIATNLPIGGLIEHAYHYEKACLVDPEKAKLFSKDSKSEIGLGDALIAKRNNKIIMLSKSQIQEWEKIQYIKMKEIAIQKYTQNPDAMKVLQLTNRAQLWHILARTNKSVRFVHLEEIREQYRK